MRRIFRSRDILIGCGCAGFNDFFYTIAQMYPAEIAAMPRRNRLLPLMLLQRLGDDYDEKWMTIVETERDFNGEHIHGISLNTKDD